VAVHMVVTEQEAFCVCITFNGSFVELHDTDVVKQNLTFLLF
jgi:hypothetical protein